MGLRTLDDLTASGQRLGVRVDINSPLEAGALADDARLRAHVETLSELARKGARVAVLAHQGRPGGEAYATLESHAARLDELLEYPVAYVDGTFSRDAREAIRALDPGELVVLENTRFYAEEYMEFTPARAAETFLVAKLAPALDGFVNDAFAAAHRSHPSLVGFPACLPSYAGRVMERELAILGEITARDRPRVYFLGGAKVTDSLRVVENVLERDVADTVLTGGLVGNVFLFASGIDLGDASADAIEERDVWTAVDRAGDLLETYGDRIQTPRDVAIERDGERRELTVGELPPAPNEPALDVGPATIDAYTARLEAAGTAILNGPAGVYEKPAFAEGTRGIYQAATAAGYSIIGGGDTAAALRQLDITDFDHRSTGGGAALRLLCGDSLPAVEALRTTVDNPPTDS